MTILFYGDPHGEWRPLLAAVQQNRPAAVVLLGDCDLDMPLRQKLAPVWDLVPCWHELAQRMGVRLVVHGHHHVSYEGRIADGIAVRGLAQTEPWLFDPSK